VLDPVGSTSWHNRHLACFVRLNELLLEANVSNPTVMLVGPGAVTRAAAPLLSDAAVRPSTLRKLIGDVARYSDQALRRVPWMGLRSLEPAEVESVLSVPHRLIVVDRSQRVLAAVGRQVPAAECHLLDISFQPAPQQADVVIAFNVICRLDDPEAGMAHVAAAVRPGGWLLIDDRSARTHLNVHTAFTPVAAKTYLRATDSA
jgi:SAM-dependent methyltransferase